MEKNTEILNEAKSRFQQIMEYTTVRDKFVDEAGEEDAQEQQPAGGDMPADPGMGGAEQGGMPPMDASQQPMDGGMPGGEMPADPGMGGAEQGGPEGFNPQVPQDDMSGMDPNAAMPPMDGGMPADPGMGGDIQPDDDVIDVSDLTDSQEETQEEVDKISDKFDKVMKYLGQFEELIKANDEKINDLKTEFEKRNPTQVEKLSMQTAKSYPFNVTPEDYWKEKEETSNYRVEDDDNGKEQGQYVITKNDVDGAVDWKSISDSLDDFDLMHQTMKNTTGLPF